MPGDGSLRRQAARLGRIGRDRSGAIALTAALLSTVLLGFAALAIDVSSWESTKGRMQGTADEAALSAGVAFQAGQNLTLEAHAIAAGAGFVNGQSGAVVTVNQPPLSGNYTADKTAIEVVISEPATATFSQLFLQSPPTVSARAVVAQTGAGACVIVLATSGSSVTMSGSGKFTLSNCDYYNDSSSSSDTLLSGNSGISAQDVYLAGNWLGSGDSGVTAANTFKTDAPAIPDPYAGRVEPSYSGCDKSNVVVTSSQTFSA
ncbi:MAG: pilus assembly protein TadG-related protein, partial [Acetobacteraceae bacterium]